MTKKETSQLMAIIKAAYPNYYGRADQSTIKMAVSVMFDTLSDIQSDFCLTAVYEYIAKGSEFAPTAGQVRQIAVGLKDYTQNPLFGRFDDITQLYQSPKTIAFLQTKLEEKQKLTQNKTIFLQQNNKEIAYEQTK